MKKFFGREEELKILNSSFEKSASSFIVIKGRRRVGKTRLIKEFCENHPTLFFSGLPPVENTSDQDQREEFVRQACAQMNIARPDSSNWGNIFLALSQAMKDKAHILVLDEISWMGGKDHSFLGHLKNAWDLYFSCMPKFILVVCGSVSSWIDKNILNNTGFVGRISVTLHLKELPLRDCAKFWGDQGGRVSSHEILRVLSVTGGIPKYLEDLITHKSSEENIQRMCFSSSGLLFNEFDRIFGDLFSKRSSVYKDILVSLVDHSCNLNELYRSLEVEPNGTYIQYVEDLENAGFVRREYTWEIGTGKHTRLSRIRLSDSYTRFYLKMILPHAQEIRHESISAKNILLSDEYRSVIGMQFETLVLNNLNAVCQAMHLPVDDIQKVGPFFQNNTKVRKGCQIDALLQTYSRTLYLIEIKFSKNQIGPEVKQEIQQKIDRLSIPRGYSVRPVLIHVNGVSEGVKEGRFFSHIIDFSDLLK